MGTYTDEEDEEKDRKGENDNKNECEEKRVDNVKKECTNERKK